LFHFVAAKYISLHVFDIDDQQALCGQHEVIDLDLTLVGFRDNESFDTFKGNLVENGLQRPRALLAPANKKPQRQNGNGNKRQQCGEGQFCTLPDRYRASGRESFIERFRKRLDFWFYHRKSLLA
jgi:hypothetical protein